MQKNRRIEIMDLTENSNLIGYSATENRQLKSIEEIAEFICKHGKHGDVTIWLKFSDLNEFRCFEWGTIYEIYK